MSTTRKLSVTIILLSTGVGSFPSSGEAATRSSMVGKVAPNFELLDEKGKKHALKQYRGRVVVLEWTNPRCPFVKRHCRKKTMVNTARQFAHKKVVWLAIDSSYFTNAKASRAHRKEQGLPYPILQDPSGKVGRAYGARSTPHMIVVGPKGTVRYDGAIDDDPHDEKKVARNYVSGAVAAVLTGDTPSPAATDPYGCSVKYKQ